MLGEEIAELKDGLNTFQANAFESLYDKKVTWAKNSSNTESKEIAIESEKPVAISLPSEVAVVETAKDDVKDTSADIIDEAPMAKKRVVDVAAKIIVPVPAIIKEVPVKVVETVVAAVAAKVAIVPPPVIEKIAIIPPPVIEKVAIVPPMATKVVQKEAAPVASKSVVEPKKAGGFFGFLQSDTAVQQIANKNQPTAPPAIAKAFMTPTTTPGKAEVKKEVRKSPEGLNMAMFKQDPEEIEAKKAMMAARPSLASAKAEAAKSSDERIPSVAPVKKPEVAAAESSKGMFSFLTPPEASEPEEKTAPAMVMAKKTVPVVTKSVAQPPAPTPMKKAPAPGGLFSFLTSDPSLVKPGDPDAKPTGPPAVARAFMTPTANDQLKDGESAAAMRRKAEFDQDVKDEAVKNQMMAARPSIADLKVEASKTLSKQQMRDAAAKAAGKAPVTKAPTPGFFDFFTQDDSSSDGGDLFEPRDPNAMTEKEVAMTVVPTIKAVAAPKKAAVAPVPPPKVAATTPAASGGMFGFLNSGPAAKAAPVEPKVVPAVAMAKKAAPVPAPVVKAPVPAAAASGGMFGFLNSGPAAKAPQEASAAKVAPAAASKVAVKASPVAPSKPAPASGGFFGFLGSSAPSDAPKAESKAAPAVPVAKKVAPAPPKVAVNVKPAAPAAADKSAAPSGGFFGFLNSSPAPEPKSKPTSSASVAPSSAKPAVAVGMNVKFLASISRLLKGDSSKIKAFQSATDSFRSGAVSGDAFLKTLETLFGSDALESVVVPLVSELPERDAAVKLKASFDKKMTSMKKDAESTKAPFSFSFGAPKKVEVPVPVVVAPPPKKEGFSFPSFGAPKTPASTPLKAPAAAAVKIPTGVPAGKKSAVETQIKQLVAGGDVKVFYKNISKELGRPKTLEVMPEIIKVLPKPIGVKVDAILKSDK